MTRITVFYKHLIHCQFHLTCLHLSLSSEEHEYPCCSVIRNYSSNCRRRNNCFRRRRHSTFSCVRRAWAAAAARNNSPVAGALRPRQRSPRKAATKATEDPPSLSCLLFVDGARSLLYPMCPTVAATVDVAVAVSVSVAVAVAVAAAPLPVTVFLTVAVALSRRYRRLRRRANIIYR